MLAEEVTRALDPTERCVVLALPRGGVPVAVPIATRLAAGLGLVIVRKLGVPGRPELAMGALARAGSRTEVVRNEAVIAAAKVSDRAFDAVRRTEAEQLVARSDRYGEQTVDAANRTVVLVDDGLATGTTALAAVAAARALAAPRIVLAVPVGSAAAVRTLSAATDLVICPLVPHRLDAVILFYDRLDVLSDDEVIAELAAFHP